MAPRIPASDDNAPESQEDDSAFTLEDDEPADEGADAEAPEGESPPDDERAEGGEDEGRQAPEGGGRRRVLNDGRETALQKANRLAQEAREAADRTTRELADLRAQVNQRQQPVAETPEAKAARFALMDPEQRVEARFNEAQAASQAHLARMSAALADQTDKATFSTLAASNPLYKRVAPKVEEKLAELRRMGQNVDREALAKYVIGEEVLKRSASAIPKQRQAAQQNIRRQNARPGAGRSDETTDERRQQSRRARLEDVVF